jgi:hypothetical protein
MAAQYPVLAKAPLYIRASLLFPYAQGLRFIHTVFKQDGQPGFARVFQNPPVSTQQVLHPDKYYSGVEPIDVPLPKLQDERNWKTVTSGSLGEFDHSMLLEQYAGRDEAEAIAPNWRGASAAVVERKADRRSVLLYASEWNTPENARKMFDAYRKVLKGKWKQMRIDSDTAESVTGSGDDGDFRVWISGTRVSVVEGMPPAAQRKVN